MLTSILHSQIFHSCPLIESSNFKLNNKKQAQFLFTSYSMLFNTFTSKNWNRLAFRKKQLYLLTIIFLHYLLFQDQYTNI